MKVAVYSAHQFEKEYLIDANHDKHELVLFQESLNVKTSALARWLHCRFSLCQ